MTENIEIDDNCFLAIDPGVTSGFTFAYCGDTSITLCPFQLQSGCYRTLTLLEKLAPRHIICEDFEIRHSTVVGTLLFSVQLIGVVNCFVESFGKYDPPKLHTPKAAQMKTGHFGWNKVSGKKVDVGKPKMVAAGVYVPGEAHHHAMDAMRHMMQWLHFGAGYQFMTYHEGDPSIRKQKELELVPESWLHARFEL